MLRGSVIGLRPRLDADVPILHRELYEDEPTWTRAHSTPWRPIDVAVEPSPYAAGEPNEKTEIYSVVTVADDALVGDALLWGIDRYNRFAHLGLSLLPAARGRGYGVDIVRVLCRRGFDDLALHRLQVDTLADNTAMIRAAEKVGFRLEATLKSSALVGGEFVDEVILGLLEGEWQG
jgi:RimJ/RimL family protein N-acetyltransferase